MATARPRYLSQQAVADEVGVSVKTVRRRIADGSLPAFRVGGQVRIRETDVARLTRPIPCAVAR